MRRVCAGTAHGHFSAKVGAHYSDLLSPGLSIPSSPGGQGTIFVAKQDTQQPQERGQILEFPPRIDLFALIFHKHEIIAIPYGMLS